MYNISSDLTGLYSVDNHNLMVRTRFTDQRLLHRYYGIHSLNTCCDILKRFYCVLVTDKNNKEYRFCVQYWINVNAFAALIRYTNLDLQDVEYETDEIMESVHRYHNVRDPTAENPQMFPRSDTVNLYHAVCYKPFEYLLEVATNDDEYAHKWIDNISLIINCEYIQPNADDISESMRNLFVNQTNCIRHVNDPRRYMKKDWFPKLCMDTRECCCLAHPQLNSCGRLQNGCLTVIDPMFKSGVECNHCKQVCHEECSACIDRNYYCNTCSNAIMTFWCDVKLHTGTQDWQHAMYQENWFDKIDNFRIVDNYPKNGITKQVAHNYRRVIKELQFKFASTAAQGNSSPVISGDLITADNESPLVNTLYHDMRLSHLNSTHVRIQHAFQEDDRK